MRVAMTLLSAAAMVAACTPQPAGPQAKQAWVRLPAVAGRPGAAYFLLDGGKGGATLAGVSMDGAGRAEMHESMKGAGGMMSMAPVATVVVPAGGEVRFAPGGKHVMLYDLSPALKPGATAKLTLVLGDGKAIAAEAKVVGPADAAPY